MRSSPRAVGLIVEGKTEYDALPTLHTRHLVSGCPPLSPINLRGIGSDCPPARIAKMAAPHAVTHIRAGRTQVVVCIDREHRPDCPGQLAQAVLRALVAELAHRGYSGPDLHVVVADRSFEAWILADARGLHSRRVFQKSPTFHHFEGMTGKSGKMGTVELGELRGRPYLKTEDGPDLFTKLDFAEARKWKGGGHGSKSLDKFLRTLGV